MSKVQDNKNTVKGDGLSKKERRALKVKEKTAQGDPTVKKAQETAANVQQDKSEDNKNVKSEAKSSDNAQTLQAQLSEKELRRLEWQKKLAAQGESKDKEKENLSKAELKAKRREMQEAQRQAKAAAVTEKQPKLKPSEKPSNVEPIKSKSPPKSTSPNNKPKTVAIPAKSNKNQVLFVEHLYSDKTKFENSQEFNNVNTSIHPVFKRLGAQYMSKIICGSDARCLALLSALKIMLDDIKTPENVDFNIYVNKYLDECFKYLNNCRPSAVTMTNALKHFRLQLTRLNKDLTNNERIAILHNSIAVYIQNEIQKAIQAITMKVDEKICDGDVILTYGCSSLITKILLKAHEDKKKFEVIVVDGRPHLDGQELIRRLVDVDIKCRYISIQATSFIMPKVSKVLLGAHALLTNGVVMNRTGTAQVAMVAQAFNKPVLVCCETYKFSERVLTDSFVYNEIGVEDKLCHLNTINGKPCPLKNWKEKSNKLTPLNLLYDVTPSDFITAVVTELAILPCTSVPVVLRINANEMQMMN